MTNKCIGPECDNKPKALGLCTGHYGQKRRGQIPLTPLREKTRSDIRDEWGHKKCAGCKEWQPIENFWNVSNPHSRDGLNSSCKTCERSRMIERRYNITAKQYDELMEKQGGVCAICQRDPGENNLAVDHDHSCCPDRKKSCGYCVRGLLCSDCNGAIGMLQESPLIFARALSYLGGDVNGNPQISAIRNSD